MRRIPFEVLAAFQKPFCSSSVDKIVIINTEKRFIIKRKTGNLNMAFSKLQYS